MWQRFRKFCLEYSDLPTMLSNVCVMLKTMTLNVDPRDTKRSSIICYVLMAIASVFYFYAYVFSAIWFIFWRCVETGDQVSAMILFSLSSTSIVSVIKLYYMIIYEEKLKTLMKKYLACDSRIVKGTRFSTNMTKVLRQVKKRAIVFWMVLLVDAVLYVIKPIVMPGRHLTVDGYVVYGLEPMFESPNFEIITVVMSIDVLFICYIVANVACFLIVIIGYTEAQMLSLCEELIHLWEDANDHYQNVHKISIFKESKYKNNRFNVTETDVVNEYVRIHLIDIIGRHATNVEFIQEIEFIMRGPNAVGFLFLIVGLIAELLGRLENTFLQLPFTLIQLGVDCYLGQKIVDANVQFQKAVYDCKWENFNQFNKKIVLVMLQNSQRTLTLTAGGMAAFNFSCFMSVLRSTYSAYTTLHSMF